MKSQKRSVPSFKMTVQLSLNLLNMVVISWLSGSSRSPKVTMQAIGLAFQPCTLSHASLTHAHTYLILQLSRITKHRPTYSKDNDPVSTSQNPVQKVESSSLTDSVWRHDRDHKVSHCDKVPDRRAHWRKGCSRPCPPRGSPASAARAAARIPSSVTTTAMDAWVQLSSFFISWSRISAQGGISPIAGQVFLPPSINLIKTTPKGLPRGPSPGWF